MRVVQVINSFGLDRGGAERLARGLHSDLLDLGADAHIIALEPCATDGLKNARSLGIANPRDPRAAIRLARALGSLATPDSVVHGHLFPTILHLTMLRRAGRIAAPCTMTEHNTWNKRRDSWLWRRLDRAIYSQFDRIAAISTQTRDALTTAHPQVAAKTVTVRNGAALRFVTPPERPDTSTPPTILTVARLARAKNIETALAALHQIADRPWSYVVAGDGALRPVLEARANELGIADRVTFLGNVTDVTELLRSADIFLLPSLWEGFGLAIQAYQKRGVPMVEWTARLARKYDRKFFVRLVKGAYWDTEIKLSHVGGFKDFPVFTRKLGTDVSYLACAEKMLAADDAMYPAFATHNAYTIGAIKALAGEKPLEFQRLHGMGEPLYNFENVRDAMKIAMDGEGISLSRRRITLSTSGVVPEIARAGAEIGCMLAISFHATDDETRDKLVPINKKWNIEKLLAALKEYPKLSNSERITFEYVMLDGVNDSDEDARRLIKLIEGIPAKINLIPFNEWPGAPYKRSSNNRIRAFANIIYQAGYASPIRTPRGEDIMAACGQLKSATERERKSRKQIEADAGM